jgi:antitoxin component YwqK of YwqJK toxin-antitoxin module
MKCQKVLFPYIFLFSLSIYSQNKLVSSFSDFYDNSCKCQIFGIGKEDLNGLKQGKWELLNKKNNSPYGEGNYVNDEKNGEWIYFFSNSRTVNVRINHVNGKNVGKYFFYDIEGNINNEGNFNNEGKLDGIVKTYNNNVVNSETEYVNGQIFSEKKNYEDGTPELISSYSIKDGKTYLEKIEFFYENSNKLFSGNFSNGSLTGKWEIYYPSGEKIDEMYFGGGETYNDSNSFLIKINNNDWSELINFEIEYDTDLFYKYQKELKYQIKKSSRIPVDTWYEFYSNGNLKGIENYDRTYTGSRLNGEYKEFFEDGSISVEGNYLFGSKIDEWKYYFNNKTLKKIVKYQRENSSSYNDNVSTINIFEKEFYDNGNTKSIIENNGGTIKEYNYNGNMIYEHDLDVPLKKGYEYTDDNILKKIYYQEKQPYSRGDIISQKIETYDSNGEIIKIERPSEDITFEFRELRKKINKNTN